MYVWAAGGTREDEDGYIVGGGHGRDWTGGQQGRNRVGLDASLVVRINLIWDS